MSTGRNTDPVEPPTVGRRAAAKKPFGNGAAMR
jgi:hypothetical protein